MVTLFVVLAMTIIGAFVLKITEYAMTPKPLPEELPAPAPTVYDCDVYEQHTLDVKMCEAGIITEDEIVLCRDSHCPLCKPERERRQYARDLAAKEKFALENSQLPDRPKNVPSYAHASDFEADGMLLYRMWSWTDPSTGFPMAVKEVTLDGERLRASFEDKVSRFEENGSRPRRETGIKIKGAPYKSGDFICRDCGVRTEHTKYAMCLPCYRRHPMSKNNGACG